MITSLRTGGAEKLMVELFLGLCCLMHKNNICKCLNFDRQKYN